MWITKEAALRLLCHADKSARNDRENSPCEKADSRDNAENIKNLESTFELAMTEKIAPVKKRILETMPKI